MNTWSSKIKTYRAKRRSAPQPGFRKDEVLFLDRDQRHTCEENPDGSILVHEGLVFRAYPTPRVKAALSAGQIEEIPAGVKPPDANYIDDDLVGSILTDSRIVAVLERNGVSTVEELVEASQSGALEKMKGIGASSRSAIAYALAENGLIQYVDTDDDL